MRKEIKKLLLTTLISIVVSGAAVVPANAKESELTGKTSMEITQMMGKGWNLGNSLDADGGNKSEIYSQEQSWGNPKITKELIDGVKAAGFNTIRIPTTWYKYVDAQNGYKIDDAFMAHVTEVVDYAYDNDMFVILNVHHEKWVNDKELDKNYIKIGEELTAVWEQIADNFAEYDQHLIFEGMNEPRAKDTSFEWTGNAACYDAVNYLDQLFVTTIRENGKGHNGERALMIPGYAASNSQAVLKSIKLPVVGGDVDKNIIISVHCYSPYNFCLSDAQTTFNPNNTNDTADITNMMSNLNAMFLIKGIPVVIGECGATNSGDNLEAREAWFTYFGEITKKYNVPAVLWDNGSKGNSGGECHNYFYRKTGEVYSPTLISSFIYGNTDGGVAKDLFIDFEPYKTGAGIALASPEQYGFLPKSLGKSSQINHTTDAAVGYSMEVTVDYEQSHAEMDLSKYAGKSLNFKAYAMSASNDTLTVGVTDDGSKDIVTAQLTNDWTEINFSYTFSNDTNEKKIYFNGAGVDTFYIDDISVIQVSENEMVETSVSGGAQNLSGAEEAVAEVKTDVEAQNSTEVHNSGSTFNVAYIAIAVAVIGIVLIVLAIVISSIQSKKKKEN